jgi:hypothetical protein
MYKHTTWLCWIGALFVLAIMLVLSLTSAVYAQGNPTPTATAAIDALQTRVSELEATVIPMDLNLQRAELKAERDLLPFTQIAGLLGLIGLGVGISTPLLLRKWIHERAKKELDAAIYRVNPVFIPVYWTDATLAIKEKLEKLGFKDLRAYKSFGDFLGPPPQNELLDALQHPCIVLHYATTKDDVDVLQKFIESAKPDVEQVAFIIFAPTQIPGGNQIQSLYPTITFGNGPTTVATHVFSFARVLI